MLLIVCLVMVRIEQFGADLGASMSAELPEAQKHMIDRAIYLRGRIITHFAQCEFLLADISARVDGRFVYLLEKRVKALGAITSAGGPYEMYADELVPLAEHILKWAGFLCHRRAIRKPRAFTIRNPLGRHCRLTAKPLRQKNCRSQETPIRSDPSRSVQIPSLRYCPQMSCQRHLWHY